MGGVPLYQPGLPRTDVYKRQGLFDALGDQFDVLDLAADDALHGGDFAINDADFAALAARADYRRHRVGAQINCNYIISVFHFSALYLTYSFLYL